MSENILLTITLLVSDRESTIEKCMKSLVHLREAVPSELIVVDTAGNEACMDIVRQYTDKIVRFQWCDDFSAARNAGVEKARGQWLMYLDDDEWFESTEELERFFLSGDYRKYSSASYKQRNYYDLTGTQWGDMDAVRLAKRVEGIRFIRKIHEQFFPLNSPVCYLNDYVHHYGYVFSSPQEKDKHFRRNIQLLIEQHKEYPEDTQTTAQLIQEYCTAREYFSAIELCRELWPDEDTWDTAVQARYATYAAVAELRAYIMQKRYADGYEAGNEMLAFLKHKENSILAQGVLFNLMTEFCYHLEKYEETLGYIGQFEACKKEWDKYPNPQSLDPFSDCAPHMSSGEACRLSLLRLHIHVLQEDWENAKDALLSVNWQADDILFLNDTPADVVTILKRDAALMRNTANQSVYISALNSLYDREDMRYDLYTAIDALEIDQKEVLLTYLHHIAPEDVKMCVFHIIYAGTQGNAADAVTALEKMSEENYPFFSEDRDYWDSVLKLNIDVNAYMHNVSIYYWMKMSRRLWDVVELDICEKAYLCLIRGLEKTDLRYLYISALLMEKKLAEKEKILEEKQSASEYTAEEIWRELHQLSQYWVSCAASIYREDVFMSDLIRAIPPCYQFGWYIMQANAVRSSDPSLFIHKVADAAKAYPPLKELCKKVIREG